MFEITGEKQGLFLIHGAFCFCGVIGLRTKILCFSTSSFYDYLKMHAFVGIYLFFCCDGMKYKVE